MYIRNVHIHIKIFLHERSPLSRQHPVIPPFRVGCILGIEKKKNSPLNVVRNSHFGIK